MTVDWVRARSCAPMPGGAGRASAPQAAVAAAPAPS
jgi:hypothetical protein